MNPAAFILSWSSGFFRTLAMACSHLSQMAFGVPLGKAKPYIKEVAKGYPMSRSLGTPAMYGTSEVPKLASTSKSPLRAA